MKRFATYVLLVLYASLGAQDRIILLNGAEKKGQIREIGPDYIKFLFDDELLVSTPREDVMLLEYKNGLVEIINPPEKNAVYLPIDAGESRIEKNAEKMSGNNQLSINTLALVNADVAVFYERLMAKRRFGIGAMGAYNLNNYVGVYNLFLSPLSNAKKHYDLGLNFNYYFSKSQKTSSVYVGLLFKYTYFTFSKTVLGGNPPGSTISYLPASGYQMSTLLTTGSQRKIGDNFLIKTIFGLGGFNLKSDYLKEYNYQLGQANPRNVNSNVTFLLKLYVGINAGYIF